MHLLASPGRNLWKEDGNNQKHKWDRFHRQSFDKISRSMSVLRRCGMTRPATRSAFHTGASGLGP